MQANISLNDLKIGETAIISSIPPEHPRLLNLGIIPGTTIQCIGHSPLKDPCAYLVRGTVIALRHEDSSKIHIKDICSTQYTIALAGNPNVGKSTLFNTLTGMNQHTGNWPGKTVTNAVGYFHTTNYSYKLVDLPGTYSMVPCSYEEEVAKDYICALEADLVFVICDATTLEHTLTLALQILDITKHVILCLNLMDEAKLKHITIDTDKLSQLLNIPVVPMIAKSKNKTHELLLTLDSTLAKNPSLNTTVNPTAISNNSSTSKLPKPIHDYIQHSECICKEVVTKTSSHRDNLDRKIDKIVTSKCIGYPLLLLLLTFIFWLTIVGANYPSQLISHYLFALQDSLETFCIQLQVPYFLYAPFLFGVYRVLAWVVSVMLPPMAIFFPLFTLLEDVGYLPRIAYNLDRPFQHCHSCGKQSLCMCMGFGCNAAGVMSCRIIDSPRERLLAILTNNFVPCNGRFPTLITLLTLFFIGTTNTPLSNVWVALLLTGIIVLSVLATFLITKCLSLTLLKGTAAPFVLELPSYRTPQVHKIIVRSILDRTLRVLMRAIKVAAPAGLVIWILANIQIYDQSLFTHLSTFLDPFARQLGLDGTILLAFILGLPANEIVLPIIIMGYLSEGSIMELENLSTLKQLFIQHNWTYITATCTILFSLFHWPCSTTLLTIKQETNSVKWTLVAAILPTLIGIACCFLISHICLLFS